MCSSVTAAEKLQETGSVFYVFVSLFHVTLEVWERKSAQ